MLTFFIVYSWLQCCTKERLAGGALEHITANVDPAVPGAHQGGQRAGLACPFQTVTLLRKVLLRHLLVITWLHTIEKNKNKKECLDALVKGY